MSTQFVEKCFFLPEEQSYVVEETLADIGFANFYIEKQLDGRQTLKLYFLENGSDEISPLLLQLGLRPASEQVLNELDWLKGWLETLSPFEVTPGVWIDPHPERTPGLKDKGIVMHIVPGTAFGTGLHATTQLAAKLLATLDLHECSVIDIGCGTGILALLALKKGAASVVAIDEDDFAIQKTLEVFEQNGVSGTVLKSNLLQAADEYCKAYDVVVANIIYEVHEALFAEPRFNRLIGANTRLIFSGINLAKRERMRALLATHHMRIIEERTQEDWYACAVIPA